MNYFEKANRYCTPLFLYIFSFLFLSFTSLAPPVFAAAPSNIQFTPHNDGISGSNVVGVQVDPNTPTTIYALTSALGVYKTTDSGSNWAATNTGLPSNLQVAGAHLYGDMLTMDQNDPSILYLNINGRIYKTTDSAANWAESDTGIAGCPTDPSVMGVAIDPSDSTHLFAGFTVSGCAGGLYESNDSGANWTHLAGSALNNDVWPVAIDPTDSTNLYAAPVHIGFAYSSDGGDSWTVNTPSGDTSGGGTMVAVHPQTPSRVFFGDLSGLYLSTDRGRNWTSKTSEVPGIVWDIDFAVSDPSVGYIASDQGVYKTTDGGLNWSAIGSHSTKSPRSIEVDPTDKDIVYLGSSASGMYQSTNGGTTFTAINTGIPTSINLFATAIAPSNHDIIYAGAYGLGFYKSTDRGYHWQQQSNTYANVNNTRYIIVDPGDPNIIYAGFDKIYKSVDGGVTFSTNYDPGNGPWLIAAAIDPADSTHLIVSDGNNNIVYETHNSGTSWTPIASFTPASYVEQIVFDQSDPSRVYAATYDYMWYSTDSGATWSRTTTGLTTGSDNWLDTVLPDPSDSSIVYAGTRDNHVMKSTDYGVTWTTTPYAGNGLDSGPVKILSTPNGDLYAFGYYSWKISTDRGDTWTTMPITGITSSYYTFKYSALFDPDDPSRLIYGDGSLGFNIYENYQPAFTTSTITRSLATATVGDNITYTVTVTNSGPRTSTSTNLRVTLPTDFSYKSGTAKIDSFAVSGTPLSGSVLQFNLGSLARNESNQVEFVLLPNTSGSLQITPKVYSTEDTDGTSLSASTITVSAIGSSSASSTPSTTDTQTCSDTIPAGEPDLFQIDVTRSKATVYYSPVLGANKYFISFGRSQGSQEYGAELDQSNTSGVSSYTVNYLQPNTMYYFKIRAGNGCAPGSWSDTIAVRTTQNGSIQKKFYKHQQSVPTKVAQVLSAKSYLQTTNESKTQQKISITPSAAPSITIHSEKKQNHPSTSQKAQVAKHCIWFFCW